MVLDQCMFTAFLYGAEAWGNISIIEKEIRNIELKAVKSIMRVKQFTSTDLIYFELDRADIVSKVKDLQFKFFSKISIFNIIVIFMVTIKKIIAAIDE